jgi:multiple sugar transport system permease protein
MVPGAITMIPNYLILQQLGWLNTFIGLIIPGAASAYGTFMLRQYMLTLPKGLEEAARIDGASLLRVWWDIVLPLCKPAMITLAIFTFTGTWTSFTWPLIVAPDERVRVLPVALQYFSSGQSTAYTLLMAASLIMMLPMLILFVFGQKYFVRGIQLGGVKG